MKLKITVLILMVTQILKVMITRGWLAKRETVRFVKFLSSIEGLKHAAHQKFLSSAINFHYRFDESLKNVGWCRNLDLVIQNLLLKTNNLCVKGKRSLIKSVL